MNVSAGAMFKSSSSPALLQKSSSVDSLGESTSSVATDWAWLSSSSAFYGNSGILSAPRAQLAPPANVRATVLQEKSFASLESQESSEHSMARCLGPSDADHKYAELGLEFYASSHSLTLVQTAIQTLSVLTCTQLSFVFPDAISSESLFPLLAYAMNQLWYLFPSGLCRSSL